MRTILLLLLFWVSTFAGDIYSPNGRYEMKQISDMRRDQFLIDTQTGKVWVTVFVPYDAKKDPDDGFVGLQPMLYHDGSLAPDPAGVKNANGRYKLDQISAFRRDQFLLDTFTGRVWGVVATDSNATVFQPIPFSNGTFTPDGKK